MYGHRLGQEVCWAFADVSPDSLDQTSLTTMPPIPLPSNIMEGVDYVCEDLFCSCYVTLLVRFIVLSRCINVPIRLPLQAEKTLFRVPEHIFKFPRNDKLPSILTPVQNVGDQGDAVKLNTTVRLPSDISAFEFKSFLKVCMPQWVAL